MQASTGNQKDLVIVFWASPNGKDNWEPVERDAIPEWLKDDRYIERMIESNQCAFNASQGGKFYRVTVVDSQPVDPKRKPS